MAKTQSHITKALREIIKNEQNSIKGAVAREALNYHNPESFFDDLVTHGCISGMVSSLIYYRDTHAFFDAHYDEIEELRLEYFEATGIAPVVQGDMKNWFAWFSFEETSRMIVDELGM